MKHKREQEEQEVPKGQAPCGPFGRRFVAGPGGTTVVTWCEKHQQPVYVCKEER